MDKTWAVSVEQGVDGECYVSFPPEMLAELGWRDGDSLIWSIAEDGAVSLRKVEAEAAPEINGGL